MDRRDRWNEFLTRNELTNEILSRMGTESMHQYNAHQRRISQCEALVRATITFVREQGAVMLCKVFGHRWTSEPPPDIILCNGSLLCTRCGETSHGRKVSDS